MILAGVVATMPVEGAGVAEGAEAEGAVVVSVASLGTAE